MGSPLLSPTPSPAAPKGRVEVGAHLAPQQLREELPEPGVELSAELRLQESVRGAPSPRNLSAALPRTRLPSPRVIGHRGDAEALLDGGRGQTFFFGGRQDRGALLLRVCLASPLLLGDWGLRV